MIRVHKNRLVIHRLSAAALLVAAMVFFMYWVSAVAGQGGLLVYGLDKSIGIIKQGDRFDRSITVCNLTLQPANISVVRACSCSAAKEVHRRVYPFTVAVIHLSYHIVARDSGIVTTRAIFKCAFPNGKEVLYMVASSYTVT